VSENFSRSLSVKVDWLKLRRKILYCLTIFAIINEKLIKENRLIRVARSARRRKRSHCNIMAARGKAVIEERRNDECVAKAPPLSNHHFAAIMLQ